MNGGEISMKTSGGRGGKKGRNQRRIVRESSNLGTVGEKGDFFSPITSIS